MNEKSDLRLFATVGPLGAGKTTLTVNTIRALTEEGIVSKERCAYILNDEGTGGTVDGALVGEAATVVPMVNGCFTCSDETDLLERLKMLEGKVSRVFLEGFGIVSGSETKGFLESAGYPFDIVCVVDYRHFRQNLARYSEIVESQLRAATLGVGITKYPEGIEEVSAPELQTMVDYIAERARGIPLFLVPPGGSVPFSLFEKESEQEPNAACGHHHHGHTHEHHHEHGHEHHHHHDEHPLFPYSLSLKPGVRFEDIRAAIAPMSEKGVLRAKGAVEGRLFNAVFDEWKQTFEDNRSFVTFYADKPILIGRDLPALATLVLPDAESRDTEEPSYALMRKESVSREETVMEIEKLLEEIPSEPMTAETGTRKRLITHPEILQTLKEVARRPSVKEEYFPRALKRCMEYWLRCVQFLRSHESEIEPDELPVNKRELGVSLAWWAVAYPEHFGEAIIEETKLIRPGTLVAEGVETLRVLNRNPERAYWQCEEFILAFRFGLNHGDSRESILKAAEHCASLATTPALKAQWETALARLRS